MSLKKGYEENFHHIYMNIRDKNWDNGANLNEFGQNKRNWILGV